MRQPWINKVFYSILYSIHLHLEEFQFTEKHFLSNTLGYKPRPPIGLKFHWTLALICVTIARLIVFWNGVLNFIVYITSIFYVKYFEIYRQKHSLIVTVWRPNKRSSLFCCSFDARKLCGHDCAVTQKDPHDHMRQMSTDL